MLSARQAVAVMVEVEVEVGVGVVAPDFPRFVGELDVLVRQW